jgi:putative ABC transport system substrate-binding protein
MPTAAEDRDGQDRISALLQGLQQWGWTVGRNVRMEYRWDTGGADAIRKGAAELVGLAPDIIVANGSVAMGPLMQLTRTVPIVFATVADPVGQGYVNNLSRPGRNATGFVLYEFGLAGKWLELLKEMAPQTTRVAILRDASLPDEIERALMQFARAPNSGLIVTGGSQAVAHREVIAALATRYKLPAVYFRRLMVESGGLVSYGPDLLDHYRLAAGYVDRILKGEKPADLPVQAPTKYELVINMKTAKTLGLKIPPILLARADEVIE